MLKNPWVVIGIVTIILFGGAIAYSNVANERNNEGVVAKDHLKGNSEASVVLVEYSDFQCPACAAFQPYVADVIEAHGAQLRFEYKHYPLPIHPFAQQAAIAAEAAGQQDKFFEFHDKLFENQTTWVNSNTPNVFFIQYAEELGLDVELFRRHMKSSLLRDVVRADLAEARELGLTGTPTFFLNGERMTIETYQDFADQIARAVNPGGVTASSTDGTGSAVEENVRFGI